MQTLKPFAHLVITSLRFFRRSALALTCSAAVALLANAALGETPALADMLQFGVKMSEESHGFSSDQTAVIKGTVDQPARQLLPPATPHWEGGRVQFTMKVDPDKQNYLTVRLSGDDVTHNKLVLFSDGKQIGQRHLGEVEILDQGADEPMFNRRFVYATTPLPLNITQGKTTVNLEIRASGPTWGYASSFEQYQKPMTEPSRGIYAVYTHVNGFFVPPSEEKQGVAPADVPVRTAPGPEVLDGVKARLTRELNGILNDKRPIGQIPMHLLARAYFVKWTPAFQNPKAIEQVIRGLDALFARYRQDPKIAEGDPGVHNSDWFGLGLAGETVHLLAKSMAPSLDAEIDDGRGGKIARRVAWSEMLIASRDWHREHRRQYTNQSMITDLNIYQANRGVVAIDPAHAAPEAAMLRYLYEACGMEPWLGSETPNGPSKPLGDYFMQLTAKGLTKELGFVGYYGEVLDWMTQIYDATRPEPGSPGDPKLKQQLEKAARARAYFRYPMLDAAGHRAMRAETVVGWRDVHFPGDVTYGERPTWDASPLYAAAALLDDDAIGFSQQMFEDGQFFPTIERQLKTGGLRTSGGLLGVPDQYESLKSQAPRKTRLPMTPGQPDFAFADEEDGVVAVKQGEEILYASLYWRARHAVNFLARVHLLTPTINRIATVREETEFEPSGMFFTRPDWVNFGFANGGPRYPKDMHLAAAGEKLPIARIPEGIAFKPGQENIHAGRGSFYTLKYGNYFIAMNCTETKTFQAKVPMTQEKATDLISRKSLDLTTPVSVGPRNTIVLRLDAPID